MPSQSHLINGIITLPNTGERIENALVTVTHAAEALTTYSNANGEYIINLGDLQDGWAVGDTITIQTSYGNRSNTLSLVLNSDPAQTADFELAITNLPQYEYDTQHQVVINADDNKDKDIQLFYNSKKQQIKIIENDGRKIKTTYIEYNPDGTQRFVNVVIKNA